MPCSPLLIGLAFPVSAAFLPAAGCLPFLAARIWYKHAATKKTLLPFDHGYFSRGMQILAAITDEAGGIIEKRPRKNMTGKNQKGEKSEKRRKGEKLSISF
jgi:hypothetical protein